MGLNCGYGSVREEIEGELNKLGTKGRESVWGMGAEAGG